MDEILAKSKAYEHVKVTHDPVYEDQIIATEIVKKFIRDRGLILYGGTAIDYALRLHGDCIYPDTMLAVPDLDFFSPNHVQDSYDLADLLYEAGYTEARAIYALHIETQRVDLKSNHWMADITYRPKEIFDILPIIEFEGMKVIHPDYQRLDLHSSLCFPYDGPPREVIFNRWSKDIKRFNLLDKYYPINCSVPTLRLKKSTIPFSFTHKCLLGGFAAYAVICTVLKRAGYTNNDLDLSIDVSDDISFDDPNDTIELVSHNLESAITYTNMDNVKMYHPYINITPKYATGLFNGAKISIYSIEDRLLSYKSVTLDGRKFRIVSAQYLLMQLLSTALRYNSSLHKYAYISLLNMIKNTPSNVNDTNDITSLSVNVFGSHNSSLSKIIAINMLDHELKTKPLLYKPTNYKAEKKTHPQFDIKSMLYYEETGKEISD